jgi:hypothetical protein
VPLHYTTWVLLQGIRSDKSFIIVLFCFLVSLRLSVRSAICMDFQLSVLQGPNKNYYIMGDQEGAFQHLEKQHILYVIILIPCMSLHTYVHIYACTFIYHHLHMPEICIYMYVNVCITYISDKALVMFLSFTPTPSLNYPSWQALNPLHGVHSMGKHLACFKSCPKL